MEGDGTAANIVETISDVWRKDDLNPVNSCWFASDNVSTFTGAFKVSKQPNLIPVLHIHSVWQVIEHRG
jgi:hypothetical protein